MCTYTLLLQNVVLFIFTVFYCPLNKGPITESSVLLGTIKVFALLSQIESITTKGHRFFMNNNLKQITLAILINILVNFEMPLQGMKAISQSHTRSSSWTFLFLVCMVSSKFIRNFTLCDLLFLTKIIFPQQFILIVDLKVFLMLFLNVVLKYNSFFQFSFVHLFR